MRKINLSTALNILFGAIGIILQSNDFKLSGTSLLVLTILKYAYDSYMSFNAQDVANFANETHLPTESKFHKAKRKTLYKPLDVKQWSKK